MNEDVKDIVISPEMEEELNAMGKVWKEVMSNGLEKLKC